MTQLQGELKSARTRSARDITVTGPGTELTILDNVQGVSLHTGYGTLEKPLNLTQQR